MLDKTLILELFINKKTQDSKFLTVNNKFFQQYLRIFIAEINYILIHEIYSTFKSQIKFYDENTCLHKNIQYDVSYNLSGAKTSDRNAETTTPAPKYDFDIGQWRLVSMKDHKRLLN